MRRVMLRWKMSGVKELETSLGELIGRGHLECGLGNSAQPSVRRGRACEELRVRRRASPQGGR